MRGVKSLKRRQVRRGDAQAKGERRGGLQKPAPTGEEEDVNGAKRSMARHAPVEIDFLGLEKGGTSAGASSTGGTQDALFGLDTQLLRTFLNSRRAAAVDEAFCKRLPSPVPVMGLTFRSPVGSPRGRAAPPLTIFYNGTVSVFDLPRHKAEAIIRWAEMSNAGLIQRVERATDALAGDGSQQQRPGLLLDKLGGDIPLARKKSLQRFLEKRKERLTAVLPCPGSTSSSSCDWAGDFGEDDKGKSSWKRQKLSSI